LVRTGGSRQRSRTPTIEVIVLQESFWITDHEISELEAILVGHGGLFRLLAANLSRGILGLLQHNLG
jgi:hypothetical protein